MIQELSTDKTLVLVTCCRDMWSFEMLAKSIRQNLMPCKIVIILNEEDIYFNAWIFWYKTAMERFFRHHKVAIYKRSDVYDFEVPEEHKQDGWVNQQILKLFASELVDTPEYVCIDSKNFFFKKTNINNIKQVEQTTKWLYPYLEEWAKNCCNSLNVEYTGKDKFALTQNITPFVIKTEWCKKLIDNYSDKYSFFNNFFDLKLPSDSVGPSEFILYDIFCKKHNYTNTDTVKQNSAVIWDHCLDKHEELHVYVLEQYKLHGVTVSGFHASIKGRFTLEDCVRLLNRINSRQFLPKTVDYPF